MFLCLGAATGSWQLTAVFGGFLRRCVFVPEIDFFVSASLQIMFVSHFFLALCSLLSFYKYIAITNKEKKTERTDGQTKEGRKERSSRTDLVFSLYLCVSVCWPKEQKYFILGPEFVCDIVIPAVFGRFTLLILLPACEAPLMLLLFVGLRAVFCPGHFLITLVLLIPALHPSLPHGVRAPTLAGRRSDAANCRTRQRHAPRLLHGRRLGHHTAISACSARFAAPFASFSCTLLQIVGRG